MSLGLCLHTGPSAQYPHGRINVPGSSVADDFKKAQRDARIKSNQPSDRVGYPEKDTRYVHEGFERSLCGRLIYAATDHPVRPIVRGREGSERRRCC